MDAGIEINKNIPYFILVDIKGNLLALFVLKDGNY